MLKIALTVDNGTGTSAASAVVSVSELEMTYSSADTTASETSADHRAALMIQLIARYARDLEKLPNKSLERLAWR